MTTYFVVREVQQLWVAIVFLQQVCFFLLQVAELKGESIGDKEKVFKMYHTNKMYYFQAESKEIVDKWVITVYTCS